MLSQTVSVAGQASAGISNLPHSRDVSHRKPKKTTKIVTSRFMQGVAQPTPATPASRQTSASVQPYKKHLTPFGSGQHQTRETRTPLGLSSAVSKRSAPVNVLPSIAAPPPLSVTQSATTAARTICQTSVNPDALATEMAALKTRLLQWCFMNAQAEETFVEQSEKSEVMNFHQYVLIS